MTYHQEKNQSREIEPELMELIDNDFKIANLKKIYAPISSLQCYLQ